MTKEKTLFDQLQEEGIKYPAMKAIFHYCTDNEKKHTEELLVVNELQYETALSNLSLAFLDHLLRSTNYLP